MESDFLEVVHSENQFRFDWLDSSQYWMHDTDKEKGGEVNVYRKYSTTYAGRINDRRLHRSGYSRHVPVNHYWPRTRIGHVSRDRIG